MLGTAAPQAPDLPGPLLIIIGAFSLFAALGLAGSVIFQIRAWRGRRAMEGRRRKR